MSVRHAVSLCFMSFLDRCVDARNDFYFIHTGSDEGQISAALLFFQVTLGTHAAMWGLTYTKAE